MAGATMLSVGQEQDVCGHELARSVEVHAHGPDNNCGHDNGEQCMTRSKLFGLIVGARQPFGITCITNLVTAHV